MCIYLCIYYRSIITTMKPKLIEYQADEHEMSSLNKIHNFISSFFLFLFCFFLLFFLVYPLVCLSVCLPYSLSCSLSLWLSCTFTFFLSRSLAFWSFSSGWTHRKRGGERRNSKRFSLKHKNWTYTYISDYQNELLGETEKKLEEKWSRKKKAKTRARKFFPLT